MSDHQAGGAKHAKVLRDCRAAAGKISGELANGLATTAQQVKDLAPRRISDSSEDSILLQVLLGNHLVTVTVWLHRVKVSGKDEPEVNRRWAPSHSLGIVAREHAMKWRALLL
jgi:hypothetical protein